VSISDEILALCTYFAITRKGSFENDFQAISVTSGGGQGFPRVCKSALKAKALAIGSGGEADTSLGETTPNEAAHDAVRE
jgi:hypothetical protein